MGFWSKYFRRADNEQKQGNVWERWVELLEHGARSKAGAYVTWEKSLQVSTVLCCARVIAEGLSQVPLKVYRESDDGRERQPARDHAIYDLLYRRPNPWQTSFEWRETTAIHDVLAGNGFSYINRFRGQAAELVPFAPNVVRVKRPSRGAGIVAYEASIDGETKTFAPADILHTRGPSWDSYCGLDAVKQAREAIGLAMATEETHSRFHQNGAKPAGVLSVEGVLTPLQHEQLQAFVKKTAGAGAGLPMIVDHSAKWMAQSMSGVDAQHIETRLHQVREICAFMRVMPLMVGYTDKASTYASAEQFFLAHIVHTMSPWYQRWEQRFDVQLLTEQDRRAGYYVKFNEAALLRGAMKDTAEFLGNLVTKGIITVNEARAKLEYNALDGGDELMKPANIVGKQPDEKPADPAEDPSTPPKADDEQDANKGARRAPHDHSVH
jgi:HK97 family phage portal protein